MKRLIIFLSFSILQTGCFFKRNMNTDEGVETAPPITSVVDVETGKVVYVPVELNSVPALEEVCEVRQQVVEKGPYDLISVPAPFWDTRDFDWTGEEAGFEDAEHLHVRSAWVSTSSGSPVGSFLSSGYANAGSSEPVVWTPEIDRRDNTIYMLVDGGVDLVEQLNPDGTIDLSGEARVRYPNSKTYITTQATFDVWYDCELK